MPRLENMTDEQLMDTRTAATKGELLACDVHPFWMNCTCWQDKQAQILEDEAKASIEREVEEQKVWDELKAEQLRAESEQKRALLKNVDEFRTAVARMAARIDDSELAAIDRAALTDALAAIVISVGMEELVGGW